MKTKRGWALRTNDGRWIAYDAYLTTDTRERYIWKRKKDAMLMRITREMLNIHNFILIKVK